MAAHYLTLFWALCDPKTGEVISDGIQGPALIFTTREDARRHRRTLNEPARIDRVRVVDDEARRDGH
ncbi:MAG: hypothetical protein ACOCTI_05230 [Phycisphaeraceae bacterium]